MYEEASGQLHSAQIGNRYVGVKTGQGWLPVI